MKVEYKAGTVTAYKLPDGNIAVIMPPNAAQCFADMAAMVSGPPSTTRRRYWARLNEALSAIGVSWKRKDNGDSGEYKADMFDARDHKKAFAGVWYGSRDDLGDECLNTWERERNNKA